MKFLIQAKGLDKADKVQLIISYFLQIVMVITAIIFLVKDNWMYVFLTIVFLILTFLPALIRKNYHVYLPVEFDLVVVIFIFAALFLGEIHAYYTLFWWWDIILHTTAGFLIGILGFLLVYVLNQEKKISVHLKPGFIALFAFTFAVSLGVIWELFEFMMDSVFGLNMLKSGLVDTMWDLIVDSLGALVISIIGYFYIKKHGGSLLFDRMIKRFIRKNPRLFKRKL